MTLIKFASAEVLDARIARQGAGLVKDAHRHEFQYEPRPGFLYVRSRAISSRTNDNFDHFPAAEIKKAYRTFIGKPVFVNHHNDNHRRARGVIVDAALHEDINPDGSEDTWTEVLMEVDAVRFPKLAQAIIAGEIDRTSMGTDVQFSVCSVCNNKASTPLEYCQHIPKLKGKKVRRTTASGGREDVLVYEKCYGLGFFENSLLVEEPADPTAFFLGVDTRGVEGMKVAASKQASSLQEYLEMSDKGRADGYAGRPMAHPEDPDYAQGYDDGQIKQFSESLHPQASKQASPIALEEPLSPIEQAFIREHPRTIVMPPPGLPGDPDDMVMSLDPAHHRPELPWQMASIRREASLQSEALGETLAPAKVDTLRDESCPVCGEADSYDGDKCSVCGFLRPPDEFMDPDLEKAKQVDLRQDQEAQDQAQNGVADPNQAQDGALQEGAQDPQRPWLSKELPAGGQDPAAGSGKPWEQKERPKADPSASTEEEDQAKPWTLKTRRKSAA